MVSITTGPPTWHQQESSEWCISFDVAASGCKPDVPYSVKAYDPTLPAILWSEVLLTPVWDASEKTAVYTTCKFSTDWGNFLALPRTCQVWLLGEQGAKVAQTAITIPALPSTTCTQTFSTSGIKDATIFVSIPEESMSKTCKTDENGFCTIELEEGILRYAHATHPDYLPSDSVLFTTCSPYPILLQPKEKPEAAPITPMAQSIVKINGIAMAEAATLRYDGLTMPGFTDPPHICPICGITFNSTGDFMNHVAGHISAYEELKK